MSTQIEENASQDYGSERIEHENDERLSGKGKIGGILENDFCILYVEFCEICSRDGCELGGEFDSNETAEVQLMRQQQCAALARAKVDESVIQKILLDLSEGIEEPSRFDALIISSVLSSGRMDSQSMEINPSRSVRP